MVRRALAVVRSVYGLRSAETSMNRRLTRVDTLAVMRGSPGVSAVFLISYLTYHAAGEEVHFQGVGPIRAVYFTILIPHIVLAALILPLALFTLYRGWSGKIASHRRIARWTLPLWMFVSVSGDRDVVIKRVGVRTAFDQAAHSLGVGQALLAGDSIGVAGVDDDTPKDALAAL